MRIFSMSKKYKICMILVICFSVISLVTYVYADKISDIKDDIADIKSQQSEATRKMAEAEENIKKYESEIASIEKDIEEYSKDIDSLSGRLDTVNEEVEQLEADLQDAATSYQATKDLLNTRLRALYENGFVNFWEVLFTSNGVTDFLAKYNVVATLLEYDKKVLSAVQNQKTYIASKKQDSELRKLQLEQLQYDLDKSKEALESAQAARQSKVGELQSSKTELAKLQASLKKDLEEQIVKLNREMAAAGGSHAGVFEGDFAFPVQMTSSSKPVITTRFKQWYSPWDTYCTCHSWGVDITYTGSNRNLIAIADGKVTNVVYGSTGFGYYMIINHGKNLSDGATYVSRYAHCAQIHVKVGQTVKRGQVIGVMGTTGNSTGVHLDFSLAKNGVYVNSLDYYGGYNAFRHLYTESCR